MKYTINTKLLRTDSHCTTARCYSATASSQDLEFSRPRTSPSSDGARIYNLGLSPSAEGSRIEAPGIGRGFPSQPTRGLGERCKLPVGSGAEPRPKTILVLSRRDRTPLIVMSVMLFDKPV